MPYADKEHERAYQKAYRERNKERLAVYDKERHDTDEVRARKRAYYVRTKPAHRATMRAWYEKNKEQALAKRQAWRETHKELIAEQGKAWREKNQESYLEKSKRYREEHRESLRAMYRAWKKAHPKEVIAQNQARRAMKHHAPINDFTLAQWEEIKRACGHRCVYCGRVSQRLTQDHVRPLISGGSHTADNIVPACRSCNAKKGNKELLQFLLYLAA